MDIDSFLQSYHYGRYKKKSLNFSKDIDKKALRALRRSVDRKNVREKTFCKRRELDVLVPVKEIEEKRKNAEKPKGNAQQMEKKATVKPKDTRREQLKKWKEERENVKKLQAERKLGKPVFKVTAVHYEPPPMFTTAKTKEPVARKRSLKGNTTTDHCRNIPTKSVRMSQRLMGQKAAVQREAAIKVGNQATTGRAERTTGKQTKPSTRKKAAAAPETLPEIIDGWIKEDKENAQRPSRVSQSDLSASNLLGFNLDKKFIISKHDGLLDVMPTSFQDRSGDSTKSHASSFAPCNYTFQAPEGLKHYVFTPLNTSATASFFSSASSFKIPPEAKRLSSTPRNQHELNQLPLALPATEMLSSITSESDCEAPGDKKKIYLKKRSRRSAIKEETRKDDNVLTSGSSTEFSDLDLGSSGRKLNKVEQTQRITRQSYKEAVFVEPCAVAVSCEEPKASKNGSDKVKDQVSIDVDSSEAINKKIKTGSKDLANKLKQTPGRQTRSKKSLNRSSKTRKDNREEEHTEYESETETPADRTRNEEMRSLPKQKSTRNSNVAEMSEVNMTLETGIRRSVRSPDKVGQCNTAKQQNVEIEYLDILQQTANLNHLSSDNADIYPDTKTPGCQTGTKELEVKTWSQTRNQKTDTNLLECAAEKYETVRQNDMEQTSENGELDTRKRATPLVQTRSRKSSVQNAKENEDGNKKYMKTAFHSLQLSKSPAAVIGTSGREPKLNQTTDVENKIREITHRNDDGEKGSYIPAEVRSKSVKASATSEQENRKHSGVRMITADAELERSVGQSMEQASNESSGGNEVALVAKHNEKPNTSEAISTYQATDSYLSHSEERNQTSVPETSTRTPTLSTQFKTPGWPASASSSCRRSRVSSLLDGSPWITYTRGSSSSKKKKKNLWSDLGTGIDDFCGSSFSPVDACSPQRQCVNLQPAKICFSPCSPPTHHGTTTSVIPNKSGKQEDTVNQSNNEAKQTTQSSADDHVSLTTFHETSEADDDLRPVELQTEKKVQVSEPGIPCVSEEEHDVTYFRNLLKIERDRLTSLCVQWGMTMSTDNDISAAILGQMRSVIGQAQLLMKERFIQFSGLISNCEFNTGSKPTTLSDLQGFWDMIYIQVEDVNNKFSHLDRLKANHWDEVSVQPDTRDTASHKRTLRRVVAKQRRKPANPRSSVRAHILAAKKKMNALQAENSAKESEGAADTDLGTGEKNSKEVKEKTFQGGFFSICSPVAQENSPRIPGILKPHRSILLKSTLRKSSSKHRRSITWSPVLMKVSSAARQSLGKNRAVPDTASDSTVMVPAEEEAMSLKMLPVSGGESTEGTSSSHSEVKREESYMNIADQPSDKQQQQNTAFPGLEEQEGTAMEVSQETLQLHCTSCVGKITDFGGSLKHARASRKSQISPARRKSLRRSVRFADAGEDMESNVKLPVTPHVKQDIRKLPVRDSRPSLLPGMDLSPRNSSSVSFSSPCTGDLISWDSPLAGTPNVRRSARLSCFPKTSGKE